MSVMTSADPAKIRAALADLARSSGRAAAVHLLYADAAGAVTPTRLQVADELWRLGQSPVDTLRALAEAAALIPSTIAEAASAPGRLVGAAFTHLSWVMHRAVLGPARVTWAIDQHGVTYLAVRGDHGAVARSWIPGTTRQGNPGVLDALAALTARLAAATQPPRSRTAPVASAAPAPTP